VTGWSELRNMSISRANAQVAASRQRFPEGCPLKAAAKEANPALEQKKARARALPL
jgi:hypothetical protein